jgi:hypothetical protein
MYLHKPGQTGKPGPFCPGFSLFASDRGLVQVLAVVVSVFLRNKRNLSPYRHRDGLHHQSNAFQLPLKRFEG